MVSKGDDIWVIYPLYFDRNVSRKDGRKVSKKLALDNPKAEEIKAALDSLGINAAIENKTHPSRWYEEGDRVLVRKAMKKSDLIRKTAEEMMRLRRA